MLGIDGRVLRAVWTAFVFFLLIALIYLARETIVIFTLAIFLAHLIAPLVDRVERLAPRRISRTAVLSVVYIALLSAALGILIPIGSKIGEQAGALAARLPDAIKDGALSRLPLPSWLEQWRPGLNDFLHQQNTGLSDRLLPVLRDIGPGVLAGIGSAAALILVPILSFFFLKDGRILRQALVNSA
ncbi:MAG TPA: AI-2E family transporter, partial [Bryobacteraceae bacterium]